MIPGYDTGPVEYTPEDKKAEEAEREYHKEFPHIKSCCPDYQETKMLKKDTNPKDAIGCRKPPLSAVPWPVIYELGAAMFEGASKYRRHNYRMARIRASIYFDATMRHLVQWWEGEDLDPDSGIHHITKAIASLVVLRDAMIQKMVVDDRPPNSPLCWMAGVQKRVDEIVERYPEPLPPYTADPNMDVEL